jgi:hypothetical protein
MIVDYVTAIRELHKSLGGRKLHCRWVKGHQDGQYDYDELSPEAQLNVDVDSMASEHYWKGKGTKPTTKLPHMSELRVSISINGVRFPSKIDNQLRYHINGSYLKKYMQSRNRWNEKVWHLIDFDSFGNYFSTLTGRRQVQHMKFVHDLQPLGSQKQKLQQHLISPELTQCPCCRKCEPETQNHMLQCPQNPLRKESLAQFHKDCRRTNGSRFPQIFADLVSQWLSNPTNIPTFEKSRDTFLRHDVIPVTYSNLVQQAIADQTAIGWLQATRGFLAKTWMSVASLSYDAKKVVPRPDGGHRIRQVIKALHHLTTALWAGRNSALHDSDKPQSTTIPSLVDAEIMQYHREPELILTDDSFYCEQSLHRLLSSSASIKRRWLQRVQEIKRKKANLNKTQPQITKFFCKVSRSQQPHQYPQWQAT